MLRAAVLILFLLSGVARHGCSQSYNAIYSFGDSISDTGNLCVGGCPSWLTTGQPPYGETFFGRPSGRASDGRIMIDFIGESLVVVATKPNVPAFPDAFLDAVAW